MGSNGTKKSQLTSWKTRNTPQKNDHDLLLTRACSGNSLASNITTWSRNLTSRLRLWHELTCSSASPFTGYGRWNTGAAQRSDPSGSRWNFPGQEATTWRETALLVDFLRLVGHLWEEFLLLDQAVRLRETPIPMAAGEWSFFYIVSLF